MTSAPHPVPDVRFPGLLRSSVFPAWPLQVRDSETSGTGLHFRSPCILLSYAMCIFGGKSNNLPFHILLSILVFWGEVDLFGYPFLAPLQ